MIERLVLFGATGDLAGRYLLPALAALQAAGRLPDGFEVIGCLPREPGRRRRSGESPASAWSSTPPTCRRPPAKAFVRSLRYRPVDVADSDERRLASSSRARRPGRRLPRAPARRCSRRR